MKNSRLVGRFLRSTMLTGVAAAMAAPAFAQDGDDTIIVTGSRLNQANLNSSSPVFQVDASEIDTRGATRVEDLLNILPQAFAGQTSDVANGATGTSNLNLRGLGALRTLVLMDGKRLPFGGPRTSPPNLDIIPAQLVERVDIVTGGASAVYGSDALAGVANFIMRRDFEGVEFDGQVGFYQDGNNGEFANALLDANGIEAPGGLTDGRDVLASVIFGANTADGRGNVTAFFSYQDQNEIRQDARDYSTCAYAPAAAGPRSIGGIGCVGSTTFRRFFTPGFQPQTAAAGETDTEGNPITGGVFNDPALSEGGDLFLTEGGDLVPFTGVPEQTFNFAPDNFIQRPIERFNASFFARYEITDNIEAYMDFNFMQNRTDAQIAFSGSFFRPFSVNCDNPFLTNTLEATGRTLAASLGCDTPTQTPRLSAVDVDMNGELDDPVFFDEDGDPDTPPVQVFDEGPLPTDVPLTFGYRNVTGDPRNTFNDFSTYRVVGGFRGTIGDNWAWDAFGQFARTTNVSISTGDLSFANLQDGLFVVDNGDGPVCRSGSSACIPFNVFNRAADGSSLVTREAALAAQGTGFRNGNTEQKVVGATIQGDLSEYGFQFPTAQDGVQALFGAEWREDQLDSQPDTVSQIPGGKGLTGVGGGTLPVQGEVSVWELFMETQIPLVQGAPFFEELGINGAYRYSNYTTDGNGVQNDFDTHTFSAGITWAPVADVRFRGQFQRAVRAPNVIELFTGQNTGLFNSTAGPNGLFDPCARAGATPPAATAAQCAFTGVSASQFASGIPDNTAGQLNSVNGGNPLLSPEKSDTYTAGVVWTPSFLPGFNLAVDYFDITVNEAISTIPPQTALDNCIQTGDPSFCDLIVRDGFGSLFLSNFLPNGDFAGVFATNVNIASLGTRGLDFAAGYGMDLADLGLGDLGSMNWNLNATYLFENSFQALPGAAITECAGFYAGGCQNTGVGAVPEYRHRLLTTWQTPWNIDVTATWRYYSTVNNINGASGNILDDSLDSANYLDLAAQFYVRENVTLRTGVQNVFGRDPELQTPIGTAPGNGNTLPGYYDPAGRYIFFGVNIAM